MPSLLQAALAEKASDISRMQAALTAVPEEKQALVVSVTHFSVPSLLLKTWMLTCSCPLQARIESQCKAKEEAHSARAAAEDAAARNDVGFQNICLASTANSCFCVQYSQFSIDMHLFLQVALTELRAANLELQANVVSVRHCSSPSLSLQTWMLTCSCALQARLESECKANEAAFADEQMAKTEAQVSCPPAVHSACSKLCFLHKVLQHCQQTLLAAMQLVQC